MSMFGAVDLSSFAPKSGATPADAPAGGAQGTASGALVVDMDASTLRQVAEGSAQVPVVVVLHTPRSQVSTDLAALLERLAGEYAGRFQLARVNVDTAPEVAQALQATAVPTVVALLAGQPVPMFQGSAPEEQLRALLDQLLEVAERNGITGRIAVEAPAEPNEPEETPVEREAREAIERGDWAGAEAVYDHAIAQAPADDSLQAARNQIRLLARMDGQDPAALLAAADAPGADLEAQLAGADAALTLGDINACLGRALEVVRSHTGDDRERARVRLLELFDVIGAATPEVARARRQLATLLY
ncbi:tetratricopeptide repeat protein [Actinomyces sp. MRS3W]|uniref:tetratricopeptide repeat protein n=1 Tax=Actinomyces sp. MRS3W TaxID=2800796 RepID=UPI0028FD7293|nr:tetratricopeptide repeat protein [Actinomyces sp. MRS3W]MDU0347684.1 tetratricopeptide repeat protein [Actinomyces sp. MRS3W]